MKDIQRPTNQELSQEYKDLFLFGLTNDQKEVILKFDTKSENFTII